MVIGPKSTRPSPGSGGVTTDGFEGVCDWGCEGGVGCDGAGGSADTLIGSDAMGGSGLSSTLNSAVGSVTLPVYSSTWLKPPASINCGGPETGESQNIPKTVETAETPESSEILVTPEIPVNSAVPSITAKDRVSNSKIVPRTDEVKLGLRIKNSVLPASWDFTSALALGKLQNGKAG
jgi:hypothetical protein